MASFIDNCGFIPTAGGTSDWTYSSTAGGYQSPTQASAVNGATYIVRSQSADLTQWEYAQGAYNSGTGVFARTTVLYNSAGTGTLQGGGGTKIGFTSAPALVAVVALSQDLGAGSWISYTPTVTAQGGTFTTVSATGRYKQFGKTIHLQVDVTITSAGTAFNNIFVSLPFTAAAFQYTGNSHEHQNTGKSGAAYIPASSSVLWMIDATNTSYIATGNLVVGCITYEVP